jgi:hypothetical protein
MQAAGPDAVVRKQHGPAVEEMAAGNANLERVRVVAVNAQQPMRQPQIVAVVVDVLPMAAADIPAAAVTVGAADVLPVVVTAVVVDVPVAVAARTSKR